MLRASVHHSSLGYVCTHFNNYAIILLHAAVEVNQSGRQLLIASDQASSSEPHYESIIRKLNEVTDYMNTPNNTRCTCFVYSGTPQGRRRSPGHEALHRLPVRRLKFSRIITVFSISSAMMKQNRNDEMGQLCRVPLIVSNEPDRSPYTHTKPAVCK